VGKFTTVDGPAGRVGSIPTARIVSANIPAGCGLSEFTRITAVQGYADHGAKMVVRVDDVDVEEIYVGLIPLTRGGSSTSTLLGPELYADGNNTTRSSCSRQGCKPAAENNMPDPTELGWSLVGGKHHRPLAFSRLWSRLWGRTSESDSSSHEH
jgi:hypothetical protein